VVSCRTRKHITTAIWLAGLLFAAASTLGCASEAAGAGKSRGERVINALLAVLKDEDSRVRDSAFKVLWELSERAGFWVGQDGEVRWPG